MAFTQNHWYRLVFTILTIGCLTMSLTLWSTKAPGQIPTLSSPLSTTPLPPGVDRRGTLESAAVRLDGKELFRIASPTVLNRSEPGAQIPVEIRAKQVESNLAQVIHIGTTSEPILNPKTMKVDIETINGQPVLFATDQALAEAQVLLTVTIADAQYHSTSTENLALRWQSILQEELRLALELRAPGALKQQITITAQVLLGTALLSVFIGSIWQLVGRRKQRLEQRHAEEKTAIQASEQRRRDSPATDPAEAEQEQWLFQGLRQYFSLQRRLQTLQLLHWFLFWTIAILWISAIAFSLNTFPQTRYIAKQIIVIPLVLLLTWFFTGLVNQLTDIATDRYIQSREQEKTLTTTNLQRVATIANVIKGLKMVLLYTISILWVLQWLNLASSVILTLGAVFALAISFAAQNLVKDFVNGFLILLEDQFRIGDMIKVGTTTGLAEISGLVENLNLRLTQIRTDSGHLVTIPNSTIAQVENMSRTWARADFRVEVAYDTDVNRALAIVKETVEQLAQDPYWKPMILDTQEVFGVEQISHTGILIRVWVKTLPLKQWLVARELRRRLKSIFDREHIQIGMPQQIWLGTSTSGDSALAPTEPDTTALNSDLD